MSIECKSGAIMAAEQQLELGETQKITLCEVLDRVLNKGVVIDGEATISVAGVDLVYLGLKLMLTSIETARLSGKSFNAAAGAMNFPQEATDGFR
jgi:gas vesicle protein GvpA/GvpJ/GvpM family